MAVSTVDNDTSDKDNWPIPKVMPVPPANLASGHWSTHLAAFRSKGLDAPARTPIVTVLTPDHTSPPA
jgi:hypothetical protein